MFHTQCQLLVREPKFYKKVWILLALTLCYGLLQRSDVARDTQRIIQNRVMVTQGTKQILETLPPNPNDPLAELLRAAIDKRQAVISGLQQEDYRQTVQAFVQEIDNELTAIDKRIPLTNMNWNNHFYTEKQHRYLLRQRKQLLESVLMQSQISAQEALGVTATQSLLDLFGYLLFQEGAVYTLGLLLLLTVALSNAVGLSDRQHWTVVQSWPLSRWRLLGVHFAATYVVLSGVLVVTLATIWGAIALWNGIGSWHSSYLLADGRLIPIWQLLLCTLGYLLLWQAVLLSLCLLCNELWRNSMLTTLLGVAMIVAEPLFRTLHISLPNAHWWPISYVNFPRAIAAYHSLTATNQKMTAAHGVLVLCVTIVGLLGATGVVSMLRTRARSKRVLVSR